LRIGFDHFPEPTNHGRRGCIMIVSRSFLQSINVEMIIAFDQSAKLVRVQELDTCEHDLRSS
jgi:hypothetical protein